jgi:AcrR family transcriptional regulator
MPRVTDEYRASRRAGILAAAARRFAHDGFHATSMADIISESGLSAGAVYLYFQSKEELIGAVADKALSTADEVFSRLLADGAAPSPADAVAALLRNLGGPALDDPATGVDMARIGVQSWAEALRTPELSARANKAYRQVRTHCAEVVRRWQAAGNMPPDADPERVGAAMLGLAQGFVLQRLLTGTEEADYLAGVHALLAFGAPRAPGATPADGADGAER